MSALNWPGLLSWSTKYHDGTAPSKFEQMSKEDRDFIQGALEAAMEGVEDLNKTLHDGLTKLADAGTDTALSLVALEVVDRCVDDPDCARNLEKFNGTKILLSAAVGLQANGERFAQNAEVVTKCCEILSLMLANNESLQLAAVEQHKALDFLVLEGPERTSLRDLDTNKVDPEQLRARLSLVASIVRGVPKLEELFLSAPYNGMQWLGLVFEKDERFHFSTGEQRKRLREKAALFICHLLLEKAERAQIKEECNLLRNFLLPAYKEVLAAGESDEFSVQYTEILAQAGAIVCGVNLKENDSGPRGEVVDLAKVRMEIVTRKKDEDLYGVELERLRTIVGAVAKI